MFARTKRLTLRPGWPEDAPALRRAIGHEAVVAKLARAPWPYALEDAEAFLSLPRGAAQPSFLICAREGDTAEIVGGIGIHRAEDGAHELGYWLTPAVWGRGYATEAGHAVIAMARHALGYRRLHAWHFVDNPASARVLAKLGFRPTGRTEPRRSIARGGVAPGAAYTLTLDEGESDDPLRMAA
ncbi:GNAT family N-acetyltransferase [Hephaestia caeni]|nr:GNAT family N-acetyltransferase [Hephaestia caeni]